MRRVPLPDAGFTTPWHGRPAHAPGGTHGRGAHATGVMKPFLITILALVGGAAPAAAPPAAPDAAPGVSNSAPAGPVGLAALRDDNRLMAEVADRGLDTLLDRLFEVDKTPESRQ